MLLLMDGRNWEIKILLLTVDTANEDDMKKYLYEKGILSIIMNQILLREYTGGIIDEDESE